MQLLCKLKCSAIPVEVCCANANGVLCAVAYVACFAICSCRAVICTRVACLVNVIDVLFLM